MSCSNTLHSVITLNTTEKFWKGGKKIEQKMKMLVNLSLYNTVPLWKSCLRPTVQYSSGTKESDKPVRHVFICFCSARSFRAGGVQWEAEDREKTLGVLGKSFCCGVPSQ